MTSIMFQKSGVTHNNEDNSDQTPGASDRVDRVRSLDPERSRETHRDSSHRNTLLRNNNHNRQKQKQLPARSGGVTAASSRSDISDGKSPDYYENYDYNYYAGFEVLRSDAQAPAVKSIQHKIHGQFVGSVDRRSGSRHVSRGRHVTRDRERHVTRDKETEYSDHTESSSEASSASTGGCLNDCVSDCVAITQLTAYRDCVGFCGKTCKD